MTDPRCLSRRRVLGATAVTAVALPMLVACGGDSGAAPDAASSVPTFTTGEELADAADIPVGGYAVFSALQMVITQPTAGAFKAFSSVCTHERCQVSPADTDGDPITCKCHFSQFSLTDGAVLKGPATTPLPGIPVVERDGKIFSA